MDPIPSRINHIILTDLKNLEEKNQINVFDGSFYPYVAITQWEKIRPAISSLISEYINSSYINFLYVNSSSGIIFPDDDILISMWDLS